MKGKPQALLTQRLWPYYTVHAFLPGPVHVGQSAGKPLRGRSFQVRLCRHTGQLTGPFNPQPPKPPAPIHGGQGAFNAAR